MTSRNNKHINYKIGALFFGLCAGLGSCQKVDNFKNTLDALPQVNNEAKYAYKSSYIVGDTMVIIGRLQPNNGLKIQIGQAEAAIVGADTLHYRPNSSDSSQSVLDRIKVIIAENMGSGQNIPVRITSGGYQLNAASISIFSQFGSDSFDASLKVVDHAKLSDPANVFLHCVNGKGDLYFYEPATGDLKVVKKAGTIETLLTRAQLSNADFTIDNFVTGGVNPQGTKAWLSIKSKEDYLFIEADFESKSIKELNRSKAYQAPYTGDISKLNLQVTTGIYPDTEGHVFLITPGLLYGWLYTASASVAIYDSNKGKLDYLFRSEASPKEVPGVTFEGVNPIILPDDNMMYVPTTAGIKLYDLKSRVLLKSVNIPQESYGVIPKNYIGPFDGLKINFAAPLGDRSKPDIAFGFLPKPNRKLVFLLYQYLDGQIIGSPGKNISSLVDGPKWIGFDFIEGRSYQYAKGAANIDGCNFEPYVSPGKPSSIFSDEILNYDEAGHLYMTANGRKSIIKTAIR
ncbi:MAG: hypothetical protein LBJ04_19705 [Sphingobacterium sp.]|jgi:hypothetical protein|uniref:hypothetical protein n=1 Tax=Sphingobacterium sp. TaxID=341027 RepID=UPI002824F900|nr:hypothetical protein [Sphingobacterium sp.]MDR0265452.1 hypothetical protein [Sphingobacterium sp.]